MTGSPLARRHPWGVYGVLSHELCNTKKNAEIAFFFIIPVLLPVIRVMRSKA